MNAKKLIPLVLVCLAARCLAFEEEVTRIGDELVTTLQEELKELDGVDGANNEAVAVRSYIRQVQAALTQESNRSVEQLLGNFGNYIPSDRAQKGIDALKKSLKEELRSKTDSVIRELQGILEVAREKVSRAAEPEELDKVLDSLSGNRFTNMRNGEDHDSNDATVRGLLSELSSARQFVTSWQDYLQASNEGRINRATQALRNLANRENPLMARSKIITRIEFEQAAGLEILKAYEGNTTLDDMKDIIAKLSKALESGHSSGSDDTALRATLQGLAVLEKTYREFRAGLPVSVEVISLPNTQDLAGKPDLIKLRADLLLLVLPRYLDLPDDFQASGGETPDRFLKRAMEDASRREDIAACRRIKETEKLLLKSGNFMQKDLDALRDFTAAQSQMEAGQHFLAVVSLQKSLAAGSHLIPSAKAGEMLRSIKTEHPGEYEQGMMEFLTPRPSPEFDYSEMHYRRYRPPYQGDRESGRTTVVLPVPAKESALPKPESGASPSSPEKEKPADKN